MIRFDGVDRLRGLAVCLMVLDHCLIVAGLDNHFIRHTITRAALPLFCIVAGSLAARPSKLGRLVDLVTVGLFSFALNVGVGQPDITIIFALGFAFQRFWLSPIFLTIAVLQPVTWPIPWTGYQPGLVIALMSLGRGLVEIGQLNRFGAGLPSFLRQFGRYPLTCYAGHLVILAIWQICQQ